MTPPRMLSLFSGIGGIDIAAKWAGVQTVALCEIEPYAIQVLKRRFPGVPIYRDVRDITADRLRRDGIGKIDILAGGFPCQPHSLAGKRLASNDDRDLWGECARLLRDIYPRWAVFENVPGLLSSESRRFFRRVLREMAEARYDAVWTTYGAADVGAPHQRDRIFIIGHRQDVDDTSGRAMWNDGKNIRATT
ncbi:DNA cytosine methyltransferase [Sporomusa sp. KB1]|uniref:DNA cytosine methyltransferase n=1 Tax=Sporomusa sp. KB1 TaxID=943346 RepID=UPI0011A8F08D|nr:DNA (cytosine-5-)-methyltransferase [Sporomusa sp. KB1]